MFTNMSQHNNGANSAVPHAASPLRAAAYFAPSPDDCDTLPGAQNIANNANDRILGRPYLGQDYTTAQYQIPQTYSPGPRAPRLQFPANASTVSTTTPSVARVNSSSAYASSVHSSYNPQDYAQSSPQAHPGASYSPQSYSPQQYTLPSSNYSPGYRRYDPALYQNTPASAVGRPYAQIGGSPGGNHSTASHLQESHISSIRASPPQAYPYTSSQRSDYSPRPFVNEAGLENAPYPYPVPPSVQNVPSTPPPPVLRRDPTRSSLRALPERLARTEPNDYSSSLRRVASQDSINNPTHSIFEDPIDYMNYRSSGDSETHSPSVGVQEPSPLQSAPQYGLTRSQTTGRHPQARPLPGPPPESDRDEEYLHDEEELAQQELYEQVEFAIGTLGSPFSGRYECGSRGSYNQRDEDYSFREENIVPSPSYEASTSAARPNGFRTLTTSTQTARYDQYSDEGDAEAAAGLAAMEMAAQEEALSRQQRRGHIDGESNGGSPINESRSLSDDEDYGTIDIGSYGGGFSTRLSYGGTPSELASGFGTTGHLQNRTPSFRTLATVDEDGYIRRHSARPSMTDSPGRSSNGAPARTDQSGTGGFSDYRMDGRRMSFAEGDELEYLDEQTFSSADMSGGPPNLPYTSEASIPVSRPLPPPPSSTAPLNGRPPFLSPEDAWAHPSWMSTTAYPVAPDSYSQAASTSSSSLVPRSISLTSPSATPQLRLPDRAKTDAEERKSRARRTSSYGGESIHLDQSQGFLQIGLDLPTLPTGRRFQPSKLSQKDFEKCKEPWALSSIIIWLRGITEGESELREHALAEALLALFTHKVSNMHIADAEKLAAHVVDVMVDANILKREEEWLRFEQGTVTGVLQQLTGKGCYASSLHGFDVPGRCYSKSCERTSKRIDVQSEAKVQAADWATYYKMTKEDVEKVDKKEIERQNVLHEILTTEQGYLDDLTLLKTLYRDGLAFSNPPIISPKLLSGFLKDVFGKLDAVQLANEQFLLPQLRYRQKEQGPWISVISDIFRDWIRKAKAAYIEYAANIPQAYQLLKLEEQRNSMFHQFCENARNNVRSRKLGWDSFLKAPITRLQRYGLLLVTALRNMTTKTDPEVTNLQVAIDEIKTVTRECDARVAEQDRKVNLFDLQNKLILRPEMKHVELNITQRGRELLFRGDLQRTGTNRFTWIDIHVILLDNYLIIAKSVSHRDAAGGPKSMRYDVSKMPIPMDLLVLESTDDDPVVKSSVKGITSVSTTTPRSSAPFTAVRSNSMQATALDRIISNNPLTTVDSNSSGKMMTTSTTLEGGKDRDEKTLYAFRIKHLGKESYTLYATRAEDRKIWCEKIIEAKTKHAASLHRQSAEPFELQVLADSAFAYETWTAGSSKNVLIKGTPLSRAVDENEKLYASAPKPGPICRARVNCATTFVQPKGKRVIAVGTDYGVYLSEVGDARGWTRAIAVLKVTQICVLEEFNMVLLISDKALIAYHLDVICPSSGVASSNNSSRKAPQKLSGSRDVGFFATGRMKDRTLVFYKKKDGLQSTFKILEPVLQKATERKSRMLHRGTTEFLREYDEFYVPTECSGLDLFTTSLSVATSKGFEIMNLERKTPWSVPNLKQAHTTSIAARLNGVDPIAMFRLSDGEFICVYEECAVYIDKHGEVSRGVVLEFVGKAKAAALESGFLILFDTDFVEIRDAHLGRLKQIIPGKDVRCLDNGRNGGLTNRSIKFVLQHPEQERSQIVMELVLNDGMRM